MYTQRNEIYNYFYGRIYDIPRKICVYKTMTLSALDKNVREYYRYWLKILDDVIDIK